MQQFIPNYYSFNTLYATGLNTSINDILSFNSQANMLTIQRGLNPSASGVNINITEGLCQGVNVTIPWLNNDAGQLIPTIMNLITSDVRSVATVNNTSGFLVVNLNINQTVSGFSTYILTPSLAVAPSLTISFPSGTLIGQVPLCAYQNVANIVTLDLTQGAPRVTYNQNGVIASNNYSGNTLVTTIDNVASSPVIVDGSTILGYDPTTLTLTNTVPYNTTVTNLWTNIQSISNLQGFVAFAAKAAVDIAISNPGTNTFDGVVISNGGYLFLDSSIQTSNGGVNAGGWVFNGLSNPLTRVPTMSTFNDIRSTNIYIAAGATYANIRYFNGNAAGGVVGVTPIIYFAWNTAYAAGTNIVLDGNTFKTSLTPSFTSVTLTNPLTISNGGSGQITQPAAYYALANSTIVPSGIMDTTDSVTILRGSTPYTGSVSLLPYKSSLSGSSLRTMFSKFNDSVSVKDFGAIGDGLADDTAAINNALIASKDVYVPVGTYLITGSIDIPVRTRLHFAGGRGNAQGAYPASYLIKSDSMTTPAVIIRSTGVFEGGGVRCLAGNTGDGIQLFGNNSRLINALVHGAGGDGIRIGRYLGGNSNSCEVFQCVTQYNGGHGLYIHDGNQPAAPNANACTITQLFSQFNGGDGIKIGWAFWNTLLNCLTEVNNGYGLHLSGDLVGGTAMARYNSIIGGDFNENNTLGPVNCQGYANSFMGSYVNQFIDTTDGVYNCMFGAGRESYIPYLKIGVYGLEFPTGIGNVANPNTLDEYFEGTSTLTAVGMTTSPTGGATFVKVGKMVTLDIPTITGTSNSTSFTLTGLNSKLIPSANRVFLVRTVNNGGATTVSVGWVETSTGTIHLANNLTQGGGSWTASGTKVVYDLTISYPI